MTNIDNRAPESLQHDCTLLGHGGPCRACTARAAAGLLHRESAAARGAAGYARSAAEPFTPGPVDERGRVPVPPDMRKDMGSGVVWFLKGKERWEAWPEAELTERLRDDSAPSADAEQVRRELVREGGLFGIASGTYSPRTFTRAEVLAVLKSRKAILEDRPHFTEAMRELDALISIFERMG